MSDKDSSRCIRFSLAIPAEKYLAYYRGEVRDIQVRATDNRRLRFPAQAVRKFLTHDGIYGNFEIRFDESNKLQEIRRVETV